MSSIAAFCVSDKVGGGELYLLRLLAALSDRGWETSLVGGTNPLLEAAANEHGIDYVPTGLGPKLGRATALTTATSFARQRIEFLALVRDIGATVTLLQYKLEQLLAGGRLPGTRTAVLEHGPIPAPILKVKLLRERYLRTVLNAQSCFAASGPAQQALSSVGRESVFLPGGVNVKGPTADPPRRGMGLFAGRLEPNKGVVASIDLVQRSEGVKLVIAGSGSLSKQVHAIALRDPDRITFLGPVDDVDRLIQESDFGVLLTSDPGEGRPLFALECAARRRPVVGVESSPALRALAKELPRGSVVLLDQSTVAHGALPSQLPIPAKPYTVTWPETARCFEKAIFEDQDSARHSPTDRPR